jgi:hypothetical protein
VKTKTTGYVLSEQNGVVCVVTGFQGSENPKTGDMLQSYILIAGVDPVTAARTGEEWRVCGDCPLRDGRCYAQRFQAPASVWRKQKRGGYLPIDWTALKTHSIRIGSFGDPAFVPRAVWEQVVKHCAGFIGYTHQWRRPEAQYLREYLMASVDSPAEQREAVAAGWRTFRVRTPDQPLLAGEMVCPASDEAGHRTKCDKCLFCCGRSKRGKSVAIYAHGRRATKFDL